MSSDQGSGPKSSGGTSYWPPVFVSKIIRIPPVLLISSSAAWPNFSYGPGGFWYVGYVLTYIDKS